MKKVFILSAITAAVLGTSAFADDSVQSQINDLKQKIEALEKSQAAQKTKSTSDIEERLDAIETATLVNKINWGLDSRTRTDSFDRKMADGTKNSDHNVWSQTVFASICRQTLPMI